LNACKQGEHTRGKRDRCVKRAGNKKGQHKSPDAQTAWDAETIKAYNKLVAFDVRDIARDIAASGTHSRAIGWDTLICLEHEHGYPQSKRREERRGRDGESIMRIEFQEQRERATRESNAREQSGRAKRESKAWEINVGEQHGRVTWESNAGEQSESKVEESNERESNARERESNAEEREREEDERGARSLIFTHFLWRSFGLRNNSLHKAELFEQTSLQVQSRAKKQVTMCVRSHLTPTPISMQVHAQRKKGCIDVVCVGAARGPVDRVSSTRVWRDTSSCIEVKRWGRTIERVDTQIEWWLER
jgi:hypothetical protein